MSLPYQSKFLYRGRRNSPVPHSSRFAGFDGPQYSLGSLSNKSGVDWALPRYVRNEPVMFMAGFGDDLDDINKYLDQLDESGMAPEGVNLPTNGESSILPEWMQDIGSGVKELGSKAVDFYSQNKSTVDALIKTGLTAKQAIEKLMGNDGQQLPPSYDYTPPPPDTTSIPPAYSSTSQLKPVLIKSTMSPTVISAVRALAAKKVAEKQVVSNTNTLLILGVVGIGAYFLLKGKK